MSEKTENFLVSTAKFSPCQLFRYELVRVWDNQKPTVNWLMLNPSTATEKILDPTLRRCLGYAKAWGHGGMIITNLFALRSTNPKGLLGVLDPIGPDNDSAIIDAWSKCSTTVVGWGKTGLFKGRARQVVSMLQQHGAHLFCVSTNKDGSPGHPLYLKGGLSPIQFHYEV